MKDKLTELEPVMLEDIPFTHGDNGTVEFYEVKMSGVNWVVQSAKGTLWQAFYLETGSKGACRTLNARTRHLDGSYDQDPLYDLGEPGTVNPPLLLLLGVVHLIHKGWQPS